MGKDDDRGSERKEQDHTIEQLKEIVEIVLLTGMIIIRFLPIGEDNLAIQSVGYFGVLVAAADFYIEFHKAYGGLDKFHRINGVAIVITAILGLILLLVLTGVLKINAIWSDVFTMTALLITLPKRLYMQLLGKYVTGGQ